MARRYFASSSLQGRRQSVLRGQIANLILYGSITTTEARAKTLKTEVERFISRVKKADLVTRRKVLAFLPRKEAVQRLFEQIIPQFENRVGGYVRVVKLPPRRGDNAPMARVEFVEEIAGGAESAEGKKRGAARKKSGQKTKQKKVRVGKRVNKE